MRRQHQLLQAAGYLAVLIAPAMLALSAWIHLPYFVIGFVLLVFPLARVVFGVVDGRGPPAWSERIAKALHWLPTLYAVALAISIAIVLMHLSQAHAAIQANIGWATSLWAVLMFSTCVAHELLHRRSRAHRSLGHILAGVAGYPILGYEHIRHHQMPGSTAAAEWPMLSESVWQFASRRLRAVLHDTLGRRGLAFVGDPLHPAVRGLRLGLTTTVMSLSLFAVAAGWAGIAIYLAAVTMVAFGLQVVTYLQHWGLGDDSLPDARSGNYGWEGDCRFQAWVTMGLSLHHSHHRGGSLPYYQLALSTNSPRPPAGYVLLMFAALLPPLWRRVMAPALAYWRAQPTSPLSSGRKLACVGFYH